MVMNDLGNCKSHRWKLCLPDTVNFLPGLLKSQGKSKALNSPHDA